MVSQQDKVTSHTLWHLSKLHAPFWWTKQQTVLVCSRLYLSGVPLWLVIRSLDPAASNKPTDLSHLSFCFQNCLNCFQFSLFCFPVPLTKGYLPLTLGDMHALTPRKNFYVRRTYWERVSMNIHSPPILSSSILGFLLSIFLLSCLTPLL